MGRAWTVALMVALAACGSSPPADRNAEPLTTTTSAVITTTTTTAPAPVRPTTPTLGPRRVFGHVGAPVTAGHFQLEVTGTRSDPCAGSQYQAKPGHTYFIADFRLRNIDSDDAIAYGSVEWSLFGVGAKESFPSAFLTCLDGKSPSGPHRGQTVESSAVFEIPGDARLAALVFYGGMAGPEVEFDVSGR